VRALVLAAAAALALTACEGITKATGLTAAQQQCVAVAVPAFVKQNGEGWADLTWVQKGKVVDTGLGAISAPEACNIDDERLATLRLVLQTALASVPAE
jgi:hypothetical protein